MVVCKYCDKEMSEGDFYKSRPSACKECVKSSVRANYAKNREYYQAYERERFKRPERRKSLTRAQRRRRKRHPEKARARRVVAYRLQKGTLTPSKCADCGCPPPTEAHHEDYSKPLDIIWLCFVCHRARHGQVAGVKE
jgi:hypothetical protein